MATRTWVSGVGDDANPCSRTAPCKTFAGAISKTAAGGEIDVIDPGGFGAVNITKGMTIDGGEGGGFASILAAGTNGIIINAGTQDVTIRNVSINGAGTGIAGIRILSAKTVFIENCEIFSFRSISGTDAGIGIRDARTAGGNLFVTGCTIRNNLITGILSLPASGTVRLNLVVDNCWIQGNGAGGGGIVVAQGTHANISNSSITGNGNVGVAVHQLGGGVTECNIENCVIAHNVTGILCAAGTQTVRLSHTTVIGNTTGISIASGTVASFGSNRITGNGSGNAVSPGATLPLT